MKKRTSITLDPEILRLAKKVAREKHTTVSRLIELLLRSETASAKRGIVASMVGTASLRVSLRGTDPLYDALLAKRFGGCPSAGFVPIIHS
ncbi:MAG: DUF6364 family protein [Luteolibacter sp.]|uniref:DUF6364 family protein n=1 Tax=Luteolibacter sp. TaxID=1962973 RepID=UPI0032663222